MATTTTTADTARTSSTGAPERLQQGMQQGIQAQVGLFQSYFGKMFNASIQLVELNRQASYKLLEESAADLRKVLQIKSLPEAQAFIGEQARGSLEKVRGYWLNVQHIATQNLVALQDETAAGVDQAAQSTAGAAAEGEVPSPARTENADAANVAAGTSTQDTADSPPQTGHRQHDANPAPSPLVEKLIASVAADAGTQDTRH
ncbi:phasin family protein [Noviherbaspirillum galbum]|uniref:Phasin family protein n=1 Tax=Noviherbaspirillum galbum TaxID=2709383 RepID=A0A6B3SYG3_9BURK|nr:phasin family protein [Noviherbaspirillum galbum]NEX63009.1 phasin family protein [Noviherbaspirillum galbum]